MSTQVSAKQQKPPKGETATQAESAPAKQEKKS